MCFFTREYDIEIANRAVPKPKPSPRTVYVATGRATQIQTSQALVVVERRTSQYVPEPRSPMPLIRSVTPSRPMRELLAAPPTPTILVAVEGNAAASPRTSRTSVASKKNRRSKDDLIYINKARETVLLQPIGDGSRYRYVDGRDTRDRLSLDEGARRSLVYETNPRLSLRSIERGRERVVVVEDGGRRREYYRKVQ